MVLRLLRAKATISRVYQSQAHEKLYEEQGRENIMLRGSVKPLICALVAFILLGTLSATETFAEDNEFEFAGTISSLPPTAGFVGDWVVAGRTVHVTSS